MTITIPPVDQIKAGRYQLTCEHWDEITSKPSEPLDFIRHRKGEVVTLNAADARRLVRGGAAVEPGAIEAEALAQAKAQLAAAQAAFDLAHNTELLVVENGDPAATDPDAEPNPASTPAPDPDGDLLKLSIVKVMEAVGSDAAYATRLLALEQGEGGANRSTLVEKLQAVITPPSGS